MFKVKLLTNSAIAPVKAYPGDAGFDIFNDSPDLILGHGEFGSFSTGIAIELQDGFFGLIQEKSGMSIKGLFTIGNVIDSGYRGEVHVNLCYMGQRQVVIEYRQKIAQLIILPCYTDQKFSLARDLTPSVRGKKGFGSSGIKA